MLLLSSRHGQISFSHTTYIKVLCTPYKGKLKMSWQLKLKKLNLK